MQQYINLCSFDNYVAAHIALGRLQDQYINCYLQDENTVTIDPILSNAIGGIKLMVIQSHVERALKILQDDAMENQNHSVFTS
jgi:hypothetical protein